MLKEVRVAMLSTDPYTNMPFLLLQDVATQRGFPIWIGLFEAGAIAAVLEKIQLKRPMTHDLFYQSIVALGGTVRRVEITDLRDKTFFGRLVLETDRGERYLDCRPSDAIALALRAGCPIFAEEQVMADAGSIDLSTRERPAKSSQKEPWREYLENLPDDSFGKYKQ